MSIPQHGLTVDERAAKTARATLEAQASGQRELAKIVERKVPDADVLIAWHERTAQRLNQLLARADEIWDEADRLDRIRAQALAGMEATDDAR